MNKKCYRKIGLAITLVMLLLVSPVFSYPVKAETNKVIFKDVPLGHVFYSSVMDLVDRGITQGYGDGYFGENDNITRAQIAVMIVRAREDLKPEGMKSEFTDVPNNYWATSEIAAAKNAGILDGYGDGRFGPDDNITRAQLSKMVANAFDIRVDTKNPVKFSDVPTNYWAEEYIGALASNEIVGGYGGGLFRPDYQATRGQFSKYLSNVLRYVDETAEPELIVKHIDVIDSRTLRVRLSDLSLHQVELDEALVDGIAKEVNFEINGISYTATVIWNQSSEPGGPVIENVIDKTITLNLVVASGEARTGQYTGDLVDDLPHGYGSFSTVNPEGGSWTYEGEWQEGEFEGEGSVTWDDGSKKSGIFSEGLLNGKGKENYVGDDFTISYEGDYLNDFYHGYGVETYTSNDGYSSVYEGNFVDGEYHGYGIETNIYSDEYSDTYEGYWGNGLKNGKGKEIQSDGTIYEGDFVDGCLHGQGRIIMPDGTIYEGDFVDYELVDGQINYSSGLTYNGELRDYLYHGQGILYDYHGEIVYSGSFANGYISQSASARASRINKIKAKSESCSVYDLKEYCEANEHQYCEVWGQVIYVEEYGNGSAWIQIYDQGIDSNDSVISIEYQMSVGETLPELWDYIDVWGTTQYMYDYESVGGFYMNTPLLYGLVIETW